MSRKHMNAATRKSLVPVLVAFPLLGSVGTQAATAGFFGNQGPLIDQAKDGAIVNVAEECGIGYFRDGNGHCRYYGAGAPSAPAHEACPPDRHFERWSNHPGGRCVLNPPLKPLR
jgi:hypothetical protein